MAAFRTDEMQLFAVVHAVEVLLAALAVGDASIERLVRGLAHERVPMRARRFE